MQSRQNGNMPLAIGLVVLGVIFVVAAIFYATATTSLLASTEARQIRRLAELPTVGGGELRAVGSCGRRRVITLAGAWWRCKRCITWTRRRGAISP